MVTEPDGLLPPYSVAPPSRRRAKRGARQPASLVPGLALDAVGEDRHEDDRALDRLRPERVYVEQHQAVGDDGDDQSSDQRPENTAPAAEEARAADHHRGDHVELGAGGA